MIKYIVIDRNAGCRPAKDEQGNIRTIEAHNYDEALQCANPGKYPPAVFNAQYDVMAEAYIREILRGTILTTLREMEVES